MFGPRDERTENLYVLAMDLDPDPDRMRMRAAISEGDLPTLLELSAPENLFKLDPGSIFVLGAALWDGWPERRPEVYRIYDQAVHLYPGDYVLQSIGGTIYQLAGRFEASMACRTAALSLRPDNPIARMRDAEGRLFNSRITEAEGGYRALLGQYPEMGEAWYILGLCRLQLGDYADALSCIERALALQDDIGWRADLTGLQYIQGHIGREQLETAIRAEVDPLRLVTLLYPLVDNSPPSRRDPAYFLEVLEQRASTFEGQDWIHIPKAAALARVGAWDAAEAELRGRYVQPEALVLTPIATDFLRGLIYAKLGRTDAARECHARGVVRMATIVGGNPAAWEHSDVARWRRECEAALGL